MRISRLLSRFLLIGCIVGAAIPCAFGQGGGGRPGGAGGPGGPGGGGPGGGRGGFGGGFGGGGIASLLGIPEVRKELNMDEESTKDYEAAAKEMRDEMMASFGGGRGNGGGGTPPDMTKMRENMAAMQVKMESKLPDILDPKQFDRLIGLYIQRDGTRTLSSKTISAKLEITEEQKTKIAEIEKAAAEEMSTMFGGGRGGPGGGGPGGGGDMREKMDKMRKDNEDKINAVLTASQKAKMEELKGPKFEFPAPQQRGGGAGGAGGRGGRGNNPQ